MEKIIVTAEIPKGLLEEWRLWVVLHGGRVLIPRSQEEKEVSADD